MGILDNLQSVLAQAASNSSPTNDSAGNLFGGLANLLPGGSNLLGQAALGSVIGSLLGSNDTKGTMGGALGGALLAGGGAMLWNKYKDSIARKNENNPLYGQAAPSLQERSKRIVRAIVFVSKSDGSVDDAERAAIASEMQKLDLGPEGDAFVEKAFAERIDPQLIASGVASAEEALDIYAVSCAAIDIDHFMERCYLDALARALNIPDDVKIDIEVSVKKTR